MRDQTLSNFLKIAVLDRCILTWYIYLSVYIDLIKNRLTKQNWQKSTWSKLLQMKWKLTLFQLYKQIKQNHWA